MIPPSTSSKCILIIEDDSGFAGLVQRFLSEEKLTSEIASDCASAIRSFEERHYDLVLLDIRLKGEDGLSILPTLKKISPKVPVVVMTGLGYDNGRMKVATEHGADFYFSKENSLTDILPILNKLMQ